jgi:hypothetical protein
VHVLLKGSCIKGAVSGSVLAAVMMLEEQAIVHVVAVHGCVLCFCDGVQLCQDLHSLAHRYDSNDGLRTR